MLRGADGLKEVIVRFKIEKNSMVVEDVYVNDVGPLKFLVTTDSPKTILDKELAERLKLELEGPISGIGAGGEVIGYRTRLGSLRMGALIMRDLQVSVIDFSQISDKLGFKISGAIASDLLRRHKAVIDYGKERIVLKAS